ncbi:hypothetical protein BN946_scf184771.g9 [Trametes cinnabarina]|uniref:HAT C-terminal dimerisation domain-containing protein n=1 Tax=Pycnoporus cinnabarinus TaxID=5643 RepID=A0A060SQ38_PYCCI|nr:hypothetical protein BN946_scf184771.g9 [Trametes cinnabarina]
MIHLTASAGLPFSWIENPVWLSFCDEFLPSAKVPSRTTLSRRLLRDEVKLFRAQAITRTAGANATLQADGWTGINNHHLVAFMLTGKREVHAVCVVDTSHERKTADNFVKHVEEVLQETGEKWKVKVIAFTSDASGESRAARIKLLFKYPYLIILDCYAHQTRWTSHYLAFKRLLKLQPAIAAILAEDELRGESTFMAGLTKADAKAKARQMIGLMKDGTFWHSLTRIKQHLEPLAIAANVAQTAHCRLDQVLLTFGFLYHRFSNLPPDVADAEVSSAVCNSIEERWSKADQAVFVAAAILNPVYMLKPFADLPELTVIKIDTLLSHLWTRFFSSPAPLELREDVKDYIHKTGRFEQLPRYVEAELQLPQSQCRSVDPLGLWEDTRVADRPLRPLATLACHLLSVCANSASCERLFSVFGQLLTKLRNRLGTDTLTGLTELKMHLRDEYARAQGMKERLKRHCGRPAEDNCPIPPPAEPAPTQSAAPPRGPESAPFGNNDLEWDALDRSTDRPARGELRAIHEALSGASDRDTDYLDTRPSVQYRQANGQSKPFVRKISELSDFSSPDWVRRVEGFASLGIDEELELYELLDFDAPGEETQTDGSEVLNMDADSGLALDVDLDDVAADIINL